MNQFIAFTKKEITEIIRTGKFLILIILFCLFGIMNPAIAKLTPWMMEMFADSLADTGIVITEIEVNALTSLTQFYKNVPIAIIIFIIMFSSTLTTEYQKGTLINMLTKGLWRWKVIAVKSFVAIALWTICYWLCYGITNGYNASFWDNRIAFHSFFAAFCIYVIGVWFITLIMLMSTLFRTNSAVLMGTGSVFVVVYLISLIPTMEKYLPAKLMSSSNLLLGIGSPTNYLLAMLITILLSILGIVAAMISFNRKAI